jgi:hypothetical protein
MNSKSFDPVKIATRLSEREPEWLGQPWFDPDKHWVMTPESLILIRDPEYYKPYIVEFVISDWCRENGIIATRAQAGYGGDVWSVRDEKDRVLFALRWGAGPEVDR